MVSRALWPNGAVVRDFEERPKKPAIKCLAIKIKLTKLYIYCYYAYVPSEDPIDKYRLHVSAIEYISGFLKPTDVFLVCGEFNLPDLEWRPSETSLSSLITLHITSDVETLLCDSLLSLGLCHVNGNSNSRGKFLGLNFLHCPK